MNEEHYGAADAQKTPSTFVPEVQSHLSSRRKLLLRKGLQRSLWILFVFGKRQQRGKVPSLQSVNLMSLLSEIQPRTISHVDGKFPLARLVGPLARLVGQVLELGSGVSNAIKFASCLALV